MRVNSLIRGIAAASMLALAVNQRRRALAEVAPELRQRGLWWQLPITNPVTLAAVRQLRAWELQDTSVPEHACEVAGAGTDAPVDVLGFDPPERAAATTGAVLWIHGGGLLIGSPERTAAFGADLAADLGVPVFLNRYRLAPEHPYPAAIDDCFVALQWLHQHASELGIDPQRIVIGGHSAGGGLAAALAQRAHDSGLPVALQVLVYPMLDDRTGLPGRPTNGGRVAWDAGSNRYGWASYLGHQPIVAERPYAAAARRTDLRGLPPAWIGWGDIDLLHDEDRVYAERLRAAGVETETVIVQGMYHGAERAVPDAPSMIDFNTRMRAAIRRAVEA